MLGRLATLLALAIILPATWAGPAQASQEDWDCWVSSSPGTRIHCIAAREGHAPNAAEDGEEETLLDYIHECIHARRTDDLSRVLAEHPGFLRHGAVWSIDTWRYPDDASWDEGRPQMLVRALLCNRHDACTVLIERH